MLEFHKGHAHTRVVKISIFLSLYKQFFTGNKTGLLQMTSPNDTQGDSPLLLSLLTHNSILISDFVFLCFCFFPLWDTEAACACIDTE